MIIQELLEIGIKELRENGVDKPISVAKKLLSFILKKDKIYLLANPKETVNNVQVNEFFCCVNSVINNMPIQYITNNQEFMKMQFYVDENVLIPRADTELVVEEAIKIIKENNFTNVLDMCTGSGAIAVSIAKYTNNCNITAVDISHKALEISQKNAILNNVNNKINFLHSNMFEKITSKYNLIISNPPYIKTDIINKLDETVKKEPIIALNGGTDGLDFYKIIENNAYKFLNENGYLVLEIGYDQKEDVENLLKNRYKDIICKKDLGGNNRVIICKRR